MPKPHSPGQMIEKIKESLQQETGKSFTNWVTIAKKSQHKQHKALSNWLKTEKGLKHTQAMWVAWETLEPGRSTQYEKPDALVNQLYSGKKAHLKPLYDAVIKEGHQLDNIEVVVCKTYSSFRNESQFAIIIPRTQSCIDVELAMPPKTQPTANLEAYQGHNEKYTHRVRLKTIEDIDALLTKHLKIAYEHNKA